MEERGWRRPDRERSFTQNRISHIFSEGWSSSYNHHQSAVSSLVMVANSYGALITLSLCCYQSYTDVDFQNFNLTYLLILSCICYVMIHFKLLFQTLVDTQVCKWVCTSDARAYLVQHLCIMKGLPCLIS